ncbi:MAG: cation transporter [Leptotrichia wadei]|uniref:HMA2 domain-containing protein n=1 Tax=Leptotrichia TaxID=32067 RepID=UPI0015C11EDF|nr:MULTISPECIES: cation transporter [Leptotrichia]MBS6019712.1 cation transporter [Leptotrichia wadei]NWO27907.1 cation transporter [Leptotrichia sp. oral taxon 417]
MLENFFRTTYLMFNQIKVVHSIPGRLRLFVPNLSKVPEELKKYDNEVKKLILSKKGIKSVEYSYITNKILLYYDPNLISEKEILEWMNKVWKTVINHPELYENKSLKEIEDNLEIFYDLIKRL